MGRKLRIEYEGAVYHVISRGNYRSNVFAKESTKAAFLKCLGEAAEKAGWVVHAWCIMSNHYHLCLETPQPNLVEGMRWLQATFSVRFNRLRKEQGHLFQGRYKALLVESSAIGAVCHYIHLNPVRAGLTSVWKLPEWKWTSLAWMVARPRPRWYTPQDALQHAGQVKDTAAGHKQYLAYLEWLQEDDEARKQLRFDRMSKDWALGSREFKLEMLKEHKQLVAIMRTTDLEPRELSKVLWQDRLNAYLVALRIAPHHIANDPKGALWKVAIAKAMKAETTALNGWLAERLNMGSPFRFSRLVTAAAQNPELTRRYDATIAKCKVWAGPDSADSGNGII